MFDIGKSLRDFLSGVITPKIVSPLPEDQMKKDAEEARAENERLKKREEYIRRGYTFSSMTPAEKLIPTYIPTPTPSPKTPVGQVLSAADRLRQQIPTYTGPTPTPAPNSFEEIATPILQKYQIPLEVAYGMRDAEGGRIGANNKWNVGAYDSNPDAAQNYATPEAAVEAFAKLLSGQYELDTIGSGKFDTRYSPAYDLRQDPVAMLQKIAELGYAGDPTTWKQRSAEQGGAGKIYDSYPEFIMNTEGWKKHYRKKEVKKIAKKK